ncbi:MAG: hypothetical protein KBB01_02930 [Candidatus Omnitrophica bacterium]|jgi:hypothetical protein|nr:hypothetical protein [Candidatus Omnitrophota bacterium]
MLKAVLISLILHLLIFSTSVYIDVKAKPLIYSWVDIVKEKDLFLKSKKADFPLGVNFSSGQLNKDYFSPLFLRYPGTLKSLGEDNFIFSNISDKMTASVVNFRSKINCFYLWDKAKLFSDLNQERVIYKAYISSYGKVLVLYPKKLPFNSYGNLHFQEYLRQAAFYMDGKFCWTNLEGRVE